MRLRTAVCAALLLLPACAPTRAGRSPSDDTRHDQNVITAEEIASSHQRSVYDVIKAVRPRMLNSYVQTSMGTLTAGPTIGSHGNTSADPTQSAAGPAGNNAIVVFMNDERLGGINVLRRISVDDVSEIRFLSPSEAEYKYGSGYPSGIIRLTARTR